MISEIKHVPKVLIHSHLEGLMRGDTLSELWAEQEGNGSASSMQEALSAVRDFSVSTDISKTRVKDIATFMQSVRALMQSASVLRRVAREAVIDASEDGIIYAEIQCCPLEYTHNLTPQDVVNAVVTGLKEGEVDVASQGKTIHARLILSVSRASGPEAVEELAELAVSNHGIGSPTQGYVVGFDLSGPESGFPAYTHEGAFKILREHLVPFTVHAGEHTGVSSIRDALAQGTQRLGQSIRLFEDFYVNQTMSSEVEPFALGDVASYVRDRQVPLEFSPSSDVSAGFAPDIQEHPFGLLYEMGFCVTVNTQETLISETTLSQEFELLIDNYGFESWQLLDITMNALTAAFCTQPLRKSLEQLIYQGYSGVEGAATPPVEERAHALAHMGQELDTEMTMERLREELAELGLDLDDEDEETP